MPIHFETLRATIEIGAGGEGGLGGVPGTALQGAPGEAAQVLELGP